MKMKTRLLYGVKQTLKSIFGITPKKDITVRMDLLNHELSDEKRNEIRELIKSHQNYSTYDVESSILENRDKKSIKEEFNELPFSRLSEDAMSEIIQIVRLDIENKIQKFGEYMVSLPDEGTFKKEMENTIK
jgi:hypothetical protein